MKTVTKEFLSSGSWVCPAGITRVLLEGLGGGAGGYGGGAGSITTGGQSGRGGLSCAMLVKIIDVVPGTTYTVTVGSGGVGRTGSTSGRSPVISSTADGGDTSFGALAVFKGASCNNTGGPNATTNGVTDKSATNIPASAGGNRNRQGTDDGSESPNTDAYDSYWFEVAAPGTHAGTSADGGAGLPGNSSRFGIGGSGGNGGVSGGAAATNGGSAGANTGAGGGSGGGSAASAGANLPGGNGGNGGSGRLRITWAE